MSEDVLILQGARTAMAELVGAFRDTSALELGGFAARAAMQRAGVEPEIVDHVVMGNALQTSGDAIYGARHVALRRVSRSRRRRSPSTGSAARESSPS